MQNLSWRNEQRCFHRLAETRGRGLFPVSTVLHDTVAVMLGSKGSLSCVQNCLSFLSQSSKRHVKPEADRQRGVDSLPFKTQPRTLPLISAWSPTDCRLQPPRQAAVGCPYRLLWQRFSRIPQLGFPPCFPRHNPLGDQSAFFSFCKSLKMLRQKLLIKIPCLAFESFFYFFEKKSYMGSLQLSWKRSN